MGGNGLITRVYHEPVAQTPSRRGDDLMLRDLTILIVDDEEDLLAAISDYIRGLGHEVITRTDAVSALDVLCSRPCDLLLSDADLKGIDGLELARMARQHQAQIAIIIMTAFDERYPLSAALRAGADAYMNKPFTLKTLGLIFERAYWETVSRLDWWEAHARE